MTGTQSDGSSSVLDGVERASSRVPFMRSGQRSSHPAQVLFVFLLGMIAVLTVIDPNFLTRPNLVSIGLAVSVLGIAAVGQTLVIISGGLDLSVGSVIALTSVVVALLLREGQPVVVALGAGMVVGVLVGAVNGIVITRFHVNAVIATLGTMSVFRGAALLIAEGKTIAVSDQTMRSIGLGEAFDIVPIPVLVMLLCFVAGSALLSWTVFGRDTYFIGDNVEAARLAGIPVRRMQVALYVLAGVFASLAGIVFTASVGAGLPNGASNLVLIVIAAVILGGTSLSGGVGRVSGTLIGVLVLGVLENGLILQDVSSFWQQVVIGTVLIIAVALEALRARMPAFRR